MNRFKKIFPFAVIVMLFFCNISTLTFAQVRVSSEQPEPVEHALFGWASAIYESHAIVTAPQKNAGEVQSAGAAFIYQLQNGAWRIQEEISPEGLPATSNFGISTAMNWETAAIGSLGDSEAGLFSEAVYLYEYSDTSFTYIQKLKPSDQSLGTHFGFSLDFSPYEELLAVGAYQANSVASKTGAVYLFEKDEEGEWIQIQKLIAEDAQSHDYFGYVIEFLDEEVMAVSAYNADGAAERSGAVYIFTRNDDGEWIQETKLYDPDGASGDLFGYSIAGTGNVVVPVKQTSQRNYYGSLFIGAPGKNHDTQTGSVYIYHNPEESVWALAHELIEQEAQHNDHFGISIAHKAGLYIGANRSGQENKGKVYKYNLFWEYIPENPLEQIPFIGNEDAGEHDFYGSKLTTSSDFNITFAFSSPYKTVDGLKNAGAVEFYFTPITSNEEEPGLVTEYKLEQNYPNPFNPTTTIKYQVKEAGDVRLSVYNLLGQAVKTIVNERQNTGAYTASFDASSLASGFYFYRLEVNDFVSTKKMMLIK